MKRKALLAITGCSAKAFETYAARDKMPFSLSADRWSDYDLDHALALSVMMRAAELVDLDSASLLARNTRPQLHPLNVFSFTGEQPLYAALVRYSWSDMPADWDGRTVVAGRWQELQALARERVAGLASGVVMSGMVAVPVSEIADRLLIKAREFGLPEGEIQAVPEDLSGFPEWFVKEERARRDLLLGRGGE